MGDLSLDEGVVSDQLVAIYVIEESIEVPILQLCLMLCKLLLEKFPIFLLVLFLFLSLVPGAALFLFFIANDCGASLSIVADRCQASWENSNWIILDEVSRRRCLSVEPRSPLLVSYSWSTKGNDLDRLEQLGADDIHIADTSQTTS